MDDMIRRSDALKELWNPFFLTRAEIDMNIKDIPAVDAVEVVRCRECRHGSYNEHYGNVVCSAHLWTRGPKYFCGDGERREGDDA